MALWPLAAFVISPVEVVSFYLMAILFAAFPIQGIALAQLAGQQWWRRALAGGTLAVFVIMQGWLVLASWRWLDLDGAEGPFRAPIDTYHILLEAWTEHGAREAIFFSEIPDLKYALWMQERFWQVVGEGHPTRPVNRDQNQGVPIPADGATFIGSYEGQTIPALFGPGRAIRLPPNEEPFFRRVEVPAGYRPALQLAPEDSGRFNNGVRILGISAEERPQAGFPWPITLVWQTGRDSIAEQYQFSIRLVDDQDARYGQWDVTSLNGWLWRAGDTVLNRIELPVSEHLPETRLRVQILMYTYPDFIHAEATDEAGNVVAPWVYLTFVE